MKQATIPAWRGYQEKAKVRDEHLLLVRAAFDAGWHEAFKVLRPHWSLRVTNLNKLLADTTVSVIGDRITIECGSEATRKAILDWLTGEGRDAMAP